MRGERYRPFIIWLALAISGTGGLLAQVIRIAPPLNVRMGLPAHFSDLPVKTNLEYACNLSLNKSEGSINDPDANQLSINHDLKLSLIICGSAKTRMGSTFDHSLGIQHLFDSITMVYRDENRWRQTFDLCLKNKLSLNLNLDMSSRIFNAYRYCADDSNNLRRKPDGAFLTPLVCNFSGGLKWLIPGYGNMNLGISSAKLTYVHNREVYSETGSPVFYGVRKDEPYRLEYGLNVQVTMAHRVLKTLRWSIDATAFKNYSDPWDLNIKNLLEMKIGNKVGMSLQFRLIYEEDAFIPFQFETLAGCGIRIHY